MFPFNEFVVEQIAGRPVALRQPRRKHAPPHCDRLSVAGGKVPPTGRRPHADGHRRQTIDTTAARSWDDARLRPLSRPQIRSGLHAGLLRPRGCLQKHKDDDRLQDRRQSGTSIPCPRRRAKRPSPPIRKPSPSKREDRRARRRRKTPKSQPKSHPPNRRRSKKRRCTPTQRRPN